jgi:acetate kinase
VSELAAAILCLNNGSSSIKAALLRPDPQGAPGAETRVAEAAVEGIGTGQARAWVRGPDEAEPRDRRDVAPDHATAVEVVLDLMAGVLVGPPALIAHRVVHGGSRHVGPARVDADLLASLAELIPLAPLHQPTALAGMRAALRRWPGVPQVACFDTAFHATLPEIARRLPLPEAVLGDEVRRYGFHGLSYAHVMWSLGAEAPQRIVIAHLGNGSSLVAVKNGRAVDTTMGFTPTGGILMGTRSGDLDPGALFYLARQRGLSVHELERICEHESGLRAVGGTSEMRTLLAAAGKDPRATLAVAMFGYAIRKAIGAFATAMGGLDLLVFTGGIGAHAAPVRAEACAGLEAVGVHLDPSENERDAACISTPDSRCAVRVVVADEESTMARETRALFADPRDDLGGDPIRTQ